MSRFRALQTGDLYTVGWIAALPKELAAAIGMLDERHGPPHDFMKPSSDSNSYHWGRIGDHNIVLTSLPAGVYGTTSAATTATHMLSSFPNIKVGLMVGIGAAIARPKKKADIRLGDVVVSLPHGRTGGVIQYDLGKNCVNNDQGVTIHTFERIGSLNSPPEALLKALTSLQAQVRMEGSKMSGFLEDMLERWPLMRNPQTDEPGYVYQGEENDRLFHASYTHTSDTGCDDCDLGKTVTRSVRHNPHIPRVHYGVIASGNRLIKDSVERGMILKESGEDCICLEMEAAGLMNSFPCLVVRGICDYADSHKNDDWQEYAAATAAAYAKELLGCVDNGDLVKTARASEILRQISDDINELSDSFTNVGESVQSLLHQNEEKEIRDWLLAPDPSINYENAIQKRHEDTGLWFIHGQKFEDWKRQPKSFLWLHGIPGRGKTVLTATIIEHLEANTPPDHVLLYFFFDFDDAQKQTLESMMRCLADQLYRKQPDTCKALNHMRENHRKGRQGPSEQSLGAVLFEMLSKLDHVSIIIDGLDESRTRDRLLDWLSSIVEAKCIACRLLVTSRREQDIEVAIRKLIQDKDVIGIQGSHVDEDIKKFVRDTVHKSKRLERWQKRRDVQDKLESTLVQNANGMFRWVTCQIDALKDCLDYPRLNQTLQNLPKTLDETYTRILDSMPKEHFDQVATILRLLIWSKPSFKILELVDAIAINLDGDVGFDPKNRMPVPHEILKLCSSLVTVTERTKHAADIDVRLAHFSVKEYLLSDHVSETFKPLISESVARPYLAKLCLTYLVSTSRLLLRGQPNIDQIELRSRFPFVSYSAESWMEHARKTDTREESLWRLVSSFFADTFGAFHLAKMFDPCWDRDEHSSPLVYASHGGLTRAVEDLIFTNTEMNAEAKCGGAALQEASVKGYNEIVKLLLHRGANINTAQGRWGSALQAASCKGHDSTVQLLINAGANVNIEVGSYGSALIAASARGHYKIVQLLLDSNADVNARDGFWGSALRAASVGNYHKISRLLLDRGADVNFSSKYCSSPLSAASGQGHDKIVQLLLDRGAKIDAQSRSWDSALLAAIKEGQGGVVRLLLERKATPSVAIFLCALYDSPRAQTIIPMILPHLTKELAIKQSRGKRGNILHHAAGCGYGYVVTRCLELGVDVDVRDNHGMTALHYAAQAGHASIMDTLVQAGADIQARDNHTYTPSDWIEPKGHTGPSHRPSRSIHKLEPKRISKSARGMKQGNNGGRNLKAERFA